MVEVIDTHAHLDEIADLDGAIERAKAAGVGAVVAVGIDYPSNNRVLEIAGRYAGFVFPALGMHPQNIGDRAEVERNLRFIADHVGEAVVVGEIGLDYHKRTLAEAGKDFQKGVLREVLGIARSRGKPVSIHSRYAWQDALEAVIAEGIERAVFHWFTGPLNVLRKALACGYTASATPAVAYHPEHRRAIRETPPDRLMLESDSPVIYRIGEGNRPSEPADVVRCVLGPLASLHEWDADRIGAQTTANARRFFGLPEKRLP